MTTPRQWAISDRAVWEVLGPLLRNRSISPYHVLVLAGRSAGVTGSCRAVPVDRAHSEARGARTQRHVAPRGRRLPPGGQRGKAGGLDSRTAAASLQIGT